MDIQQTQRAAVNQSVSRTRFHSIIHLLQNAVLITDVREDYYS